MRNVSDAGVKALAEAGCGCGLRTLILGADWLYLCPGYLWCCWVLALPRENRCGMVCVLCVVVSCHVMLSWRLRAAYALNIVWRGCECIIP